MSNGSTSATAWASDVTEPRDRSILPIVTGLAVAALVLAPVAAWFVSRARQGGIDRQTSDRLTARR